MTSYGQRMRIAFIVYKFPAISETFILNQITCLLERGHEVDIFPTHLVDEGKVHPDVHAYELMERVTRKIIPVKRVEKLGRGLRVTPRILLKDPALALRAANVFSNGKKTLEYILFAEAFAGKKPYHIIHAHYGHEGLSALGLKRILRPAPPVVTSFYGFDLSLLVREKGEEYYRLLFKEGDLLLPLSQNFKSRLIKQGCPHEKIKILPLCINLSRFPFRERSLSEDGIIRILSVARLVEKKGLEYSLRALSLLREKRPGINLHYRIVGEGPMLDKLLSLQKELGLQDVVEFMGSRSHEEVPRFFDESHIFVQPSVKAADGDEEGTPVCLMEAMASGMPVVSTFHSGIPEMVEDGKSGYLVPERDAEALAKKIMWIADHPESWGEMGRRGREIIEKNHNTITVTEELERIYKDLTGRWSS